MSANIERLAAEYSQFFPQTSRMLAKVAEIGREEENLPVHFDSIPKHLPHKLTPEEFERLMNLSNRFNSEVGQHLEDMLPTAAITTHLTHGEYHGFVSDLLKNFYDETVVSNERTFVTRAFHKARRSGLETIGAIRQKTADPKANRSAQLGVKSSIFLKYGLSVSAETRIRSL